VIARAVFALGVVLSVVACGPNDVARPTVSAVASNPVPSPAPTAPPREAVTFKSGSLDLQGFIWKPGGPGPFPAVLWNHGGDNAASDPYYDKLWPVHVRAGFLLFIPQRRGQGGSPGVSVNVQFGQAPAADRNRMQVELYSTVALADELAAFAYLKTRPDVDTSRIAVSGWSAGGQLTLIGAEADPGYRVAVACSSASVSWDASPELQQRLVATVAKIKIPVFLFQAQNDVSLNPQKVLGAEFKRLGKRYEEMVYPAHGATAQEGHAFCVDAPEVWGDRVMTFIRSNMP
jgi:dienelactone hydrolase